MSSKIDDIISLISNLNMLEINDLTKAMEKKFDIKVNNVLNDKSKISNQNIQEDKSKVEKTKFSIKMINFGKSKINVIKTIRTILSLGLKEAKEFVEKSPVFIKENIKKEEAENIKKKLEAAGAKIEMI